MATLVGDSHETVSGGSIYAGMFAPVVVAGVNFIGVTALSTQGASDAFALVPPGQAPTYPNAPIGGGFVTKHQNWCFDPLHGDIIVGGGDSYGDSEVDLFTYNSATRQFTPLLTRDQAGYGPTVFDRSIMTLEITSGGSGYADGNYPPYNPGMPGVPLTGGTGTGAAAILQITGGAVTYCVVYASGYGYTVGDVLTASAANLGGSGSGFSLTVTAISPAGTPSSIVGPVGRCLPGYAYDTNRHVMWMEGGSPRAAFIYPSGFANNLQKGGLWALDRSTTPPTWHRQGPGAGESAIGSVNNGRYDNYSSGLYYDAGSDSLYAIWGNVFRFALTGTTIDNVSRDNWTMFSFPPAANEVHGGFHAYDSLRRRIIYWSPATKSTYAFDCATNTYAKISDWNPSFNNDWHMTYDSIADRVICWVAGQYDTPYDGTWSAGYYGDYQGRRSHTMWQMAPDGTWSEFVPDGDKLLQPDIMYAQFSGAYDAANKNMVIMASNQSNDASLGAWFTPSRLTVFHLKSPVAATPPSITGVTWTPAKDGSGNVIASDWAGLPLNSWVEVAGQVLNDVVQTPHYVNYSGGDGAHSITDAWCGMAWDYQSRLGYISGGGHTDSVSCETGVYMLDANKLTFTRIRDRDPMSQTQNWWADANQSWPTGTINSLVPYDTFQFPSSPLLNGTPGAMHTYDGLVWIPPATMGNTKGGFFYPGLAKAIYDLDTGTYSTCHYNNPLHDSSQWVNTGAFIDGHRIYSSHDYYYHWCFDIDGTEATDWSATSRGKWNKNGISASTAATVGSATWGWLRERRETVNINGTYKSRVKYGAAIDAGADGSAQYTDWSPYVQEIILTSTDGSHNDFAGANLAGVGMLVNPGCVYEPETDTVFVQPNLSGFPAYRLSDLNSNTWTVTKLANSTAATRSCVNGTFGKMRRFTMNGKAYLIRVTDNYHPIQVMRVS